MFGKSYFGHSYYGPRYWADGSSTPSALLHPLLGFYPAHGWLRVFDPQGRLIREVDALELFATKEVNVMGAAECSIAYEDTEVVEDVLASAYIEIWWEEAHFGIQPQLFFRGFLRRPEFHMDGGVPTMSFILFEDMELLKRKRIGWKSGVEGRSTWNSSTPIETAAKQAVRYNMTSDAAADGTGVTGRLRTHSLGNGFTLVVANNQGRGEQRSWGAAYITVYEFLQRLAEFSGHDYALTRVGPLEWEFEWFPGKLGQDATQEVVFSIAHDNMEDPVWRLDDTSASDVYIVAGGGQAENRVVVLHEREVVAYPHETLVDARDMVVDPDDPDPAVLERMLNRAKEAAQENRMAETFTFRPVQVPATLYGVHYNFGDLVTGVNPFTNERHIFQVHKATLSNGSRGSIEISVQTKEII